MAKDYLIEYCNQCENYEKKDGVCTRIHEIVKNYPNKFLKKCNGKFFLKSQFEQPELENKGIESSQIHITNTPGKEDNETFLQKFGFWIFLIGTIGIFIGAFHFATFLWVLFGISSKAKFDAAYLIRGGILVIVGIIMNILGNFIQDFHKRDKEKN